MRNLRHKLPPVVINMVPGLGRSTMGCTEGKGKGMGLGLGVAMGKGKGLDIALGKGKGLGDDGSASGCGFSVMLNSIIH